MWVTESFWSKGRYLVTEKLLELSHPSLSEIEPECQESLIKEKPWISVKLSVRELCDSKLSGLHSFGNMAIIHWFKNRSKTEW